MKLLSCIFFAALLAILLPLNSSTGTKLHEPATPFEPRDEEGMAGTERRGIAIARAQHTLQVAGSRLPDCSHACGSCSPCKLVLVTSTCAMLDEAESCPLSYRCMCKNKSYPVP